MKSKLTKDVTLRIGVSKCLDVISETYRFTFEAMKDVTHPRWREYN